MASKSDTDLLKEAKARFKEAEELWAENRRLWLEDQKFRNREQWPANIKKEREDAGRPVLVVDKLEQYVRQVVNDGRQNRPAPKVTPVDSGGDVKVAEALKGWIRSVVNKSKADQAFDTALDHAAGNGFGFFRIVTEYEHERSFNQDVFIKRVRNPLGVMLGPHQEADGSDAEYGFVADEVRKDLFKKQYPKAKIADWKNEAFQEGWCSEDHVRIVEYFYKEKETELLYFLTDGTTATQEEYERDLREVEPEDPALVDPEGDYKPAIYRDEEGNPAIREVPIVKVKWCRLSGAEILEKKEWAGKWIPIIPVYGVERDINGKVVYEGLIRPAKDAQRLYNFSRTGFAEHVSLSTKQPPVAAAGQLEGFEDEWEKSNRENVAVLHYNPINIEGHPVPPPFRMSPTSMPSALAQDMQVSEHDIQGAVGMYSASLGERSNEKSGKAIMARQREGDTGTFHYHDNLNRAIRYLCRQLVDLAPKVMDRPRMTRLLAEDGKASVVQIDPKMKKPFEKRGELMVYNLGVGTYDVDVEAGPSYTTKRQEAADAMLELARAMPELIKVAGDLMVRNMDWPGAEEIANRLKRMLPPELQDDGEDESPEVKAVKAQAQQLIDRLSQEMEAAKQGLIERDEALANMQREVDTLRAKLENRETEAAAKLMDAGTKRYEAQTERAATLAPPITPEIIQQIADAAAEAVMSRVVSPPPEQPQAPPPGGVFV